MNFARHLSSADGFVEPKKLVLFSIDYTRSKISYLKKLTPNSRKIFYQTWKNVQKVRACPKLLVTPSLIFEIYTPHMEDYTILGKKSETWKSLIRQMNDAAE